MSRRKEAASARLRLAHTAPAQQRARDTLARIVAATERLLRKKRFEDITVAEIVEEAETSTGSFYARFASKEALLPYLYEIYNERDGDQPQPEPQRSATLAEAARRLVAGVGMRIRSQPWLLHAMALYARAYPERLPKSALERSKREFEEAARIVVPYMDQTGVDQTDAQSRARFVTYAVVTLAREHALFGKAPLAAALDMDRQAFETELARMAEAYLARG